MKDKNLRKILTPIFLAGFLLCLWAWVLVRLYVPLGGRLQGIVIAAAALAIAGLFTFLLVKLHCIERFLLPWGMSWKTALAGGAAFLLGSVFDISYAMLSGYGLFCQRPLIRLICHAGNGIVFAIAVLSLLRAGKDLKGLSDGVGRKQMLIIFLALNAVTAYYVFTSKTVYYWDQAGYWSTARALASEPFGYAHLRGVLETTITLEYNHLLAFPISLVMRLFGGSRAVYAFCISNFYTLPALWALAVMAKENKWGGLIMAGLFPMLIYAGLDGYVDPACAALGLWAYIVYGSGRPSESRGIFAGALLVFTFVLRRYFFFFALSFGAAELVRKLIFDRKKWTDFISLFLSCAFFSISFAYVFILNQVIGSNYSDIYSAYHKGFYMDFSYAFRAFGIILLIAFLAFAFICLCRKEERPRMVFCLTHILVCFAAFTFIQSHDFQHLLMYVPALAVMASAMVTSASVLASVLSGAALVFCVIPSILPVFHVGKVDIAPLPDTFYYGEQRGDIDELLALADFVDSLSAEEQHSAVVMASSFVFNSETLTNLRPSLGLPEPEHKTVIQYHGTVDKRDGFNWNSLSADYVIVADPIQTHLGEENQQTVVKFARDVLDGTGAGSAYRVLPETFTLENGATVYIYERTRDLTADEYREISDHLTALYPDYAEKYAVPDWVGAE